MLWRDICRYGAIGFLFCKNRDIMIYSCDKNSHSASVPLISRQSTRQSCQSYSRSRGGRYARGIHDNRISSLWIKERKIYMVLIAFIIQFLSDDVAYVFYILFFFYYYCTPSKSSHSVIVDIEELDCMVKSNWCI